MSFLKALGKPFMMLFLVSCLSLSAWAQGTVKGTVVDENGEPVVGATVRVNGTQAGSITDLNGAFSVSASPHNDTAFLMQSSKFSPSRKAVIASGTVCWQLST